jgi:GntR family transcriptional regulator, uxu operon transcriptional repressor
MPIQAIGTDRLYRKIAKQLSELIAAGEFPPGERLPAERELAEKMGVSRPSVREALIALEIEGKVEVRVGSGVYVKEASAQPQLAESQHGEGPFELIEARITIEGETAAHAAQLATEEEIAAIAAAVAELRRLDAAGEATDPADRAFHLAIAAATHNGPLTSVVEMLWDQGRGQMWSLMERHFQTKALRAATLRDHQAILDAIVSGNAEGAREAMRRHLSRVAREFTRGWASLKKPLPAAAPARKRKA